MSEFKIGEVVVLPGVKRGFYLVEPTEELGKLKLTPIKHDDSRMTLDLTEEIRTELKSYARF